MANITDAVVKNWATSLFGILAGLPVIVKGSGLLLSPHWQNILTVVAGIGIIGLGGVAKDSHSTTDSEDKF